MKNSNFTLITLVISIIASIICWCIAIIAILINQRSIFFVLYAVISFIPVIICGWCHKEIKKLNIFIENFLDDHRDEFDELIAHVSLKDGSTIEIIKRNENSTG